MFHPFVLASTCSFEDNVLSWGKITRGVNWCVRSLYGNTERPRGFFEHSWKLELSKIWFRSQMTTPFLQATNFCSALCALYPFLANLWHKLLDDVIHRRKIPTYSVWRCLYESPDPQNHACDSVSVVANLTTKHYLVRLIGVFFECFSWQTWHFFDSSVRPTSLAFTGTKFWFPWTLRVRNDAYHFSCATGISWTKSVHEMVCQD